MEEIAGFNLPYSARDSSPRPSSAREMRRHSCPAISTRELRGNSRLRGDSFSELGSRLMSDARLSLAVSAPLQRRHAVSLSAAEYMSAHESGATSVPLLRRSMPMQAERTMLQASIGAPRPRNGDMSLAARSRSAASSPVAVRPAPRHAPSTPRTCTPRAPAPPEPQVPQVPQVPEVPATLSYADFQAAWATATSCRSRHRPLRQRHRHEQHRPQHQQRSTSSPHCARQRRGPGERPRRRRGAARADPRRRWAAGRASRLPSRWAAASGR
jgi:hypothetical protein